VQLAPPALENGDPESDAERLLAAPKQRHQIASYDLDVEAL